MTSPKDIISVYSNSHSPSSFFGLTSSLSYTTTDAGSYFPSSSGKQLKPFVTEDIKVLLLENINQTAIDILKQENYQVEFHTSSLGEAELIEKIRFPPYPPQYSACLVELATNAMVSLSVLNRDVHAIGIRSKTKLSADVLRHAKNLLAIGCFCIGTNQVDLSYAARHGVTVFNSPFSNSRSVAELVIAEIIMLARQTGDRSMEMHAGKWQKLSAGCCEIRGKTLGIVGYGHIGSQLSVLAEAMGMNVVFYDVVVLMAMGKARQVKTLPELLAISNFVSLHVPESPETKNLMGPDEFKLMKEGSYLINASRGSVVDLDALTKALESGHLRGAALDVFPTEPTANGDFSKQELASLTAGLRRLPNVILTPHIAGSTQEAQEAIGAEVGLALVRYINCGTTIGAVNMPGVDLRSETENNLRVIFIHKNRPGVLRQVNEILGDHNVDKQLCDSRGEVAYMMADIGDADASEVTTLYNKLEVLSSKIMTRMLY